MDLSNPVIIPDVSNPFSGLLLLGIVVSAIALVIINKREGNK